MLLLDPLIRKVFSNEVVKAELSRDLMEGVLRHERKEVFISNVKKEINILREARLAKGKRPLREDEVSWMIRSMTRFFISGVKAESIRRHASQAEKTRLKAEADNIADLEATVAGKPQGDYADIVEVVGDGDAESIQDTKL